MSAFRRTMSCPLLCDGSQASKPRRLALRSGESQPCNHWQPICVGPASAQADVWCRLVRRPTAHRAIASPQQRSRCSVVARARGSCNEPWATTATHEAPSRVNGDAETPETDMIGVLPASGGGTAFGCLAVDGRRGGEPSDRLVSFPVSFISVRRSSGYASSWA